MLVLPSTCAVAPGRSAEEAPMNRTNSKLMSLVSLVAAGVALVGPALAQNDPAIPIPIPSTPDPRKTPDPPPSRSTQISGRVRSVDGSIVTFTDGRQIVVLPGVTEQRGDLRPGAAVK